MHCATIASGVVCTMQYELAQNRRTSPFVRCLLIEEQNQVGFIVRSIGQSSSRKGSQDGSRATIPVSIANNCSRLHEAFEVILAP